MRSRWVLTICLALLAGLVAFAISRRASCSSGGPSLSSLEDTAWLTRELNLSPPQAREIRALQLDLQRKIESYDSAHCAARCQLGTVLFSTNETACAANVDEMCRMQADTERATLQHIRDVHKLLTPDQQKKYEAMVTTCVCYSCPHTPSHAHKP